MASIADRNSAEPPAEAPLAAKARLRAAALERRRLLAPETRAAFAARIAREGQRLAVLWRPQMVSAFFSIREEPDTLPLLSSLSEAGFRTALPVTRPRGDPLEFRLWRPGDALVRGPMNILEPHANAPSVDPDLLFVPLAAFDRRGHRIGFGAGHYDRTLSALRKKGRIRAIGLAFSVSEIPGAPAEAHDEPLDFILTEEELIDCGGAWG